MIKLFTILLVLLNITDTILTLYILDTGGIELNPVMNYLIGYNTDTFIHVKVFAVPALILFLYLQKDTIIFNLTKVSTALYTLCGMYALLVAYEAYIIWGSL